MSFQMRGLPATDFSQYFELSDQELKALGIETIVADDSQPGYPCRIGLDHAAPDTRLLLMNYEHQPAPTPYRSAHAVYVAEGARDADIAPGVVPEPLHVRLLSVRAFDAMHMMVDATVVPGKQVADVIEGLFGNSAIVYLHIHYAMRGCYAAKVVRA